eukprot:GHVN01013080.1.p1 GENE.GHVN01013080.1~~GHVN01013080.1.p1  ORF type:complete len:238 (-),score=43.32 GHVN01013080.1:322-1035(-)
MGFAAIALTLCVVTNIIIACENVEAIPPFYARKIVHIASGIVLALINPTGASSSFIAIVFVSIVLLRVSVTPFRYSLTRSSPHTALLFILYHQPLCQPLFPRPPLTHLNPHSPHPNILSRFCQRGDIGITVYGIVVCCWCLMGLPFRYLTPMFFADPMAAVVGRSVKPEVRWYKNKTVAGSLTCFFAAYLSLLLGPITSHLYRLLVAGVMCGAEAVGGALDNMLVAVLCLAVAAVWG